MNRFWTHTILLTTAVIGAINYSIIKILLHNHISPPSLVAIRGIFASLFFILISLIVPKESILKKDYFTLIKLVLFGMVINQIFFIEGMRKSQPINAALIMTVVPILVYVIAVIQKKETLIPRKSIGIFIAFIGTIGILLTSQKSFQLKLNFSDLFILVNASSWALYIVTIKNIIYKYKTTTILKYIFPTSLLFTVPYANIDLLNLTTDLLKLPILYYIVFVLFFSTVVAYYLNTYIMKYIEPSAAAIYLYLQPPFAILIAIISKTDEIHWQQFFLGSIILLGIFIVNYKPSINES